MRDRDEALVTGVTDGERCAAFVIPHPYVDALHVCERSGSSPRKAGRSTFTRPSRPFIRRRFSIARTYRLIPVVMSRAGAVDLVRRLVCHRPKYRWLVTVPQWGLHYGALASRRIGSDDHGATALEEA